MTEFVHLHVHTAFSFLDGASSIEELVSRAAAFGMPALAMTDHDNVSGAVRFIRAADAAGIRPIIGCEVTLSGGHHLTLLATSPRGYANLCAILTRAHLENERGKPMAGWRALAAHKADLIALSGCRMGEIPALLYRREYQRAEAVARRYCALYGPESFLLEMQGTELPGQDRVNRALAELGDHLGLEVVATGNVHYADKGRYPVYDVLRCMDAGITVEEVHPNRPFNRELDLTSPQEMYDRFRWCPEALGNTLRVAERCEKALELGRPRHPRYPVKDGESPDALLQRLTRQGAMYRYRKISTKLHRRLEEELAVIRRLGMADYFLVAWDVVQHAKGKGIRSSGRGSAADSVVAYCLGLTEVDALKRGLGFERFLSLERREPPDIDIDVESDRRDEVAEYVYHRYGREHVAAVATYQTFRARGALRDVGKALGLPSEEIDTWARRMPHIPADAIESALDRYPELQGMTVGTAADRREEHERRGFWLEVCGAIAGMPRHLGTHSSGLVISREPLTHLTPLQMSAKGVVVSQFDKDDVEALGLMKLDLLFLRMLSAVRTSAEAIAVRDRQFNYDRVPDDDAATYARLRRGETVGAFQLESPAQRALHPRLHPKAFEDIVASVALIRPGPIKGEMVNPFIARRNRAEPITYPHSALRPILDKTYGVVLYQEQVIEIARVIADFTPGEADRLRRVMSSFRSQAEMDRIGEQFLQKAIAKGIDPEKAQEIFDCIRGYAGYGFCEAHAAAFATTAYKTTYLLEHYPVEFYAALLSHQPMGFYPANTLAWEAKRRGIPVRRPCINCSTEQFAVEGGGGVEGGGNGGAIRVSLRQVREMTRATLQAVLAARREEGPFRSLLDFCRRVEPLTRETLEQLVLAGAFDGLHENRRALLWQLPGVLDEARRLRDPQPQLQWDFSQGEGGGCGNEETAGIGDFSAVERDVYEYYALGLTVERHLMAHLRPRLNGRGVRRCAEMRKLPKGCLVKVAGLSVRPHRPPTKSGRTVVFLTIEDETDLIDVTIFQDAYQKYGAELFTSPMILVEGRVERRGEGVSVTARRVEPLGLLI